MICVKNWHFATLVGGRLRIIWSTGIRKIVFVLTIDAPLMYIIHCCILYTVHYTIYIVFWYNIHCILYIMSHYLISHFCIMNQHLKICVSNYIYFTIPIVVLPIERLFAYFIYEHLHSVAVCFYWRLMRLWSMQCNAVVPSILFQSRLIWSTSIRLGNCPRCQPLPLIDPSFPPFLPPASSSSSAHSPQSWSCPRIFYWYSSVYRDIF